MSGKGLREAEIEGQFVDFKINLWIVESKKKLIE